MMHALTILKNEYNTEIAVIHTSVEGESDKLGAYLKAFIENIPEWKSAGCLFMQLISHLKLNIGQHYLLGAGTRFPNDWEPHMVYMMKVNNDGTITLKEEQK